MSEYLQAHWQKIKVTVISIVSDIAIFVLKRDVKLQLTNCNFKLDNN